jgi:hypothetical protein
LVLDSQESHPGIKVFNEKIRDFCENPFHFLLLTDISDFDKYFVKSRSYNNSQDLALKMLLDNYHYYKSNGDLNEKLPD